MGKESSDLDKQFDQAVREEQRDRSALEGFKIEQPHTSYKTIRKTLEKLKARILGRKDV